MREDIIKEVKRQLEKPNKDARAYTRWWWFGCAVEKEEIIYELDEMLGAGIGGVEVQILYPVLADDEEKGIKNQFYLSPAFLESIRFACQEVKKRGMIFDMTLGSSWPFGGPFVTQELSAPNVIPYMLDVHGPCEFSYDFTTRVYGESVGSIMGRMEKAQMVPESIRDISDKMVDKYLFNWEWGKELQPIQVPEGDYKIVVFISNDKRQMVLKPLPGGEGLIIDHDRKDSLRHFLKHAGDPIAETLGDGMIRSFFCDSLEVFGQNWTNNIYDEFSNRRGYCLKPFIYALWGEIAGITDQIRYDFHKTLAELTEENFYREMANWCHEKGSTLRMQAHGTWGDILKCYATADIPEGETFSEYDRYEVNTVHRRLASSAGHLYHKQIISNESFTWLRFPRFIVTLEQMKAAADSIFLDGMNHIVNHGYAYSPPKSGKLGTPFYASSNIDHKNTWWPFYKEVGRYFNRVSDWLRRGTPVARVAIYLPQSDIWAENPMSDIHMCMKLEERITTNMVDGIQKAGYWFDYMNDDALCRIEEYSYEVLVLIRCERIPVESAEAIGRYVRLGGKLICSGILPHKSCGFLEYRSRTERVKDIFGRIEESGNSVVVGKTPENVIKALRGLMEPDVQMLNRNDVIGYVHRVEQSQDIYFIANISTEYITEEIVFARQGKKCVVFDPLTTKEHPIIRYDRLKSSTEDKMKVVVRFEPFQSLLFLFSDEIEEIQIENKKAQSIVKDISQNWELDVKEVDFKKEYKVLESWEKEPELKYFSGEGIYTKTVTIESSDLVNHSYLDKIALEFEHIGEAAEIFVNDRSTGIIFKRPYVLNLKGYLAIGENRIEIRVRNLLINYAIDPECLEKDYPEPVIEQWPYSTGKLNQNRREWIYNHRERAQIKAPFPSGIWGYVRLIVQTEG